MLKIVNKKDYNNLVMDLGQMQTQLQNINQKQPTGVKGNEPLGPWNWADVYEYLDTLTGPAKMDIYDKVRAHTPIANGLEKIDAKLMTASWHIDPVVTENVNIAKSIEKSLLHNLRTPWTTIIRNITLMLTYGFSILAPVYQKAKTIPNEIVDLELRHPRSIEYPVFVDNEFTGFSQIASSTGQRYFLPKNQITTFTYRQEGADVTGRSMLRDLYKYWKVTDFILSVLMIGIERNSVGVPWAQTTQYKNKDQEDALHKMLKQYTLDNRIAWVTDATVADIKIVGTGSGSDFKAINDILQSLERVISRYMAIQFVEIGTAASGSFAASGDQVDIFTDYVWAIAVQIADTFNRQFIKPYVKMNWGELSEYPELVVEGIKKLNTQALPAMVQSGIITVDDATENSARKALNLPPKPVTISDSQTKAVDLQSLNKDEESQLIHNIAEHYNLGDCWAHSLLQTGYEIGEMKPWEKWTDWERIRKRHADGQTKIYNKLIAIRKKQADSIIAQIIAGTSTGEPKAIHEINIPNKAEMTSLLYTAYKKEYRVAKEDIIAEVARMKEVAFRIDLPQDRPEIWSIEKKELESDTDGASSKLAQMINARALTLIRQRVKGNNLKDILLENWEIWVGVTTWAMLAARPFRDGMADGRSAQMEKENVDMVIYSARLDQNVCPHCLDKHGTIGEIGDPNIAVPNPECDGRSQCRCVQIPITKEMIDEMELTK